MDDLVAFLAICFGVVLCCFLFVVGVMGITMLTDNATCVATDAGEIFYTGPAYNINCRSQGASTQCTVGRGGWLHSFPSRHKLSNNIVINCQ